MYGLIGKISAVTGQRDALAAILLETVVIYGFHYPSLSMDPAIEAFETLARQRVRLGARAEYSDLVHPVHQAGRVFAWEIGRLEE